MEITLRVDHAGCGDPFAVHNHKSTLEILSCIMKSTIKNSTYSTLTYLFICPSISKACNCVQMRIGHTSIDIHTGLLRKQA